MDVQFFKDWGEVIAAVIFGVAAIWVAVWIYKKQTRIKAISASLEVLPIFNNPVIGGNKDIKVLYKEQKMDDLYIGIIRFKNSGQIPILKSDFESGIVMHFMCNGKDIDPIDMMISEKNPSNLEVDNDDDFIRYGGLDCGLLNPGDEFVVTSVFSEKPASMKIDARIVGVKEITDYPVPRTSPSLQSTILILILGILVVITMLATYTASELRGFPNLGIFVIGASLLATVRYAYIERNK